MCLFVIDGTWSRDFNSVNEGNDALKKPVGSVPLIHLNPSFIEEKIGRPTFTEVTPVRSNARKFYEESDYPIDKKYYYGGVRFGITGADMQQLYSAVLADIERALVSGQCREISIVGWSRGAAVATEIVQTLMKKDLARTTKREAYLTRRGSRYRSVVTGEAPLPNSIKFLGLFDSVAMVLPLFNPADGEWGETVPQKVDYFVHLVAGDRTGPAPGVEFTPRNPNVAAQESHIIRLPNSNHADVGGIASTNKAKVAYQIMRTHATNAGVK